MFEVKYTIAVFDRIHYIIILYFTILFKASVFVCILVHIMQLYPVSEIGCVIIITLLDYELLVLYSVYKIKNICT